MGVPATALEPTPGPSDSLARIRMHPSQMRPRAAPIWGICSKNSIYLTAYANGEIPHGIAAWRGKPTAQRCPLCVGLHTRIVFNKR